MNNEQNYTKLGLVAIVLFFLLYSWTVLALPEEQNKTSFLVLTDIHLNDRTQHDMEFFPKKQSVANDLDVKTFYQLLDKIRLSIDSGELPKPEFVVLLGDLVGHIRYSKQNVINTERIVFNKLKETFVDTPIFYNFGNNDSISSDYGLFLSPITKTQYLSPLHILKETWPNDNFLSTGKNCKSHKTYPCIIENKTASGYYSAYLRPKLRLIAVNSVMFSKMQKSYTYYAISDQLTWIEQQLTAVQNSHETALITMHIPPGNNTYQSSLWSGAAFWSEEPEKAFYKSVIAHYPVIIGILAGHTHKDDIKLFMHNEIKIPVSGVYISPALSTSHGNAPALRTYLLQSDDNVHWDLSDYQTYYFTRDTNNDWIINKLYSFKEKYCPQQMSRMNNCLDDINIQKIKETMAAGNFDFKEKISVPENIFIHAN